MVYVGGDCPEGERGNVWISRRVRIHGDQTLAP
jgi:hypothetical protein